ncbi:MAG TPA: translation initiation factor [Caldilineae bacterium]|nr:translation initiation factor [Caldilineae bacterium]
MKRSRWTDRRVVYSTDPEPEPPCPTCGQRPCVCQASSPPPSEQTVRIGIERKHRRGKTVTVISGLRLPVAELRQLGKSLRRLCGAGGTVKKGVIEVQGDHRERIAQTLRERGYRVKVIQS